MVFFEVWGPELVRYNDNYTLFNPVKYVIFGDCAYSDTTIFSLVAKEKWQA